MADEVQAELVKRAAGVDGDIGSCEAVFSFLFGKSNVENWKSKVAILGAMFGLMVIAAVIDIATGGNFHLNGIYPRRTDGLAGVVLAPFLHRSLAQLIINAVPFIILGALVIMREDGIRVFAMLNTLIVFGAGLIVWVIGEDTVHVGSYAFVCGYFGYILLFAGLMRDWRSTGIAIAVFMVYGTTVLSMFSKAVATPDGAAPGAQPTSWLYMLSGLGMGLLSALLEYRFVTAGSSVLHAFIERFTTLHRAGEKGSAEEKASLKGGESV